MIRLGMEQTELEIEMWKHPLFQHKISFTEQLRIRGEISSEEELEIIHKVMGDFAKLFADVRVSADDLLTVYLIKLINKRKEELQNTSL